MEFIRTPAYHTPLLGVSHSDWRTLRIVHTQANNQAATVSSFLPTPPFVVPSCSFLLLTSLSEVFSTSQITVFMFYSPITLTPLLSPAHFFSSGCRLSYSFFPLSSCSFSVSLTHTHIHTLLCSNDRLCVIVCLWVKEPHHPEECPPL